jgi:type II secretory pathway component PulF
LSRGEPLEQIVAGNIPGAPQPLRDVIRAGLATGQPGIVLEAWSAHTQRSREVRRTILSGLIYSLVLMSMGLLVVFFLAFVIPEFESIYNGFDVELPGLTAFILQLSRLVRAYWIGMLIGVALLVGGIVGISSFTDRRIRDQVITAIPLIGPVRRNLSLSTFCRLLAVLVERQVPLSQALQAAGAGSRDGVIDAASRAMAADVERGESVAIAAGQRQLPPRLAHLFRWSNQPEAFGKALRGSATMFEELAHARARLVPTVLEPIVIFGVGFFISLCILSLFMPLIELINNLS